MKKILPVLLAALCVLLLGACDLLEKKKPQVPHALRQVGHLPIWEPDPKDNEWNYVRLSPESRKWCAYAALYSTFAPETAKLLACYRHNFPQGEYVKPKPTFKYDTQHIDNDPFRERRAGNKALQAAAKELPAKPEIDLDKAAAVYVPAMTELWDAVHSAREYYKNKDFIDDDFAAGRALHERVQAAETAFSAVAPKFDSAMQFQESVYLAKELEMRTRRGDAAQAAMLRLVIEGRTMTGEYVRQIDLADARIAYDPKLAGFDLPSFRAAYDELSAAVKDVETFMGDAGQYAKEKISDSDARIVVSKAKDLKKTMADLLQRALAGEEPEQQGPRISPRVSHGSPRKAVSSYYWSYMDNLEKYHHHVNYLMEDTTREVIREVLLDHAKAKGMEAKQVIFTPLLEPRIPPAK